MPDADKIRKLEERVRRFEESLALCLGPRSPLPPLAKDVVRGFFVTVLALALEHRTPRFTCRCDECERLRG
jgi:hypothetical protein